MVMQNKAFICFISTNILLILCTLVNSENWSLK